MDSGWGTTGGGPGRPPCWRTLKESCKGLGSVSLKINTQHTHCLLSPNTRVDSESDIHHHDFHCSRTHFLRQLCTMSFHLYATHRARGSRGRDPTHCRDECSWSSIFPRVTTRQPKRGGNVQEKRGNEQDQQKDRRQLPCYPSKIREKEKDN